MFPYFTMSVPYQIGTASAKIRHFVSQEVEETLRWISTVPTIAVPFLTPDAIELMGNDLTGTSKKQMNLGIATTMTTTTTTTTTSSSTSTSSSSTSTSTLILLSQFGLFWYFCVLGFVRFGHFWRSQGFRAANRTV